jgi:hypothetical protein
MANCWPERPRWGRRHQPGQSAAVLEGVQGGVEGMRGGGSIAVPLDVSPKRRLTSTADKLRYPLLSPPCGPICTDFGSHTYFR